MNKVEGVLFDWAGTTVDFGCFAPVHVFLEIFKEAGVEISVQEARGPMGMLKKDHIRDYYKNNKQLKIQNKHFCSMGPILL
ncbi:Phosphonoacetaldehyde hydrolase [Sporomusa rhizae]|uniref:hypothetical protein n=1 Tax=Sporomusa rhizae TaxID=357999 RepID=UPI00352B95EA